MKNLRIVLSVMALAIVVNCSLPAVAQMDRSLVAEQLIAEGKEFYESGDYPKAIHEFTKVLLVDPNNEAAQYFLNEMGLNVGLLYGRDKTKMYHLADIAKNIDWYKEQLDKLEKDNAEKERLTTLLKQETEKLNALLASQQQENGQIKEKVNQVETHFRDKAAQDRAMIDELEKISAKKEKEINCLNDELCALEKTLVTKVEVIEKQQAKVEDLDKHVRDIKKEAKLQAAQDRALIQGIEKVANKKTVEIAKLSTDLVATSTKLQSKTEALKTKEETVRDLEKEINALNRDLKTTEQRWASTKSDYEQEIKKLEGHVEDQRLIKTKMDEKYEEHVKELKKTLREKQSELSAQNNKLIASDFKLELAQKALKARNETIRQLRRSLWSLEQELASVQGHNQNEVNKSLAQKGEPTQESKDRIAALKKEDQVIGELKKKLASARHEISNLEKDGNPAQFDELLALTKQLTEVKMLLKDKPATEVGKDSDYSLLSDRLKDTEGRLDSLVKMMEDRDVEFSGLEKRLSDVLMQASQ